MATFKAILVLSLVILNTLFITFEGVEGKRGCEYFGHACYGGLGKRNYLAEASEESMQTEAQETEIPMDMFKESRSQLPHTTRAFSQTGFSPKQYEQMNKYIREWVRNYLRKEHELERK